MLTEFIIPVVSAFFATLGFSFFYNIRGKNIVISALCGMFAWLIYLLVASRTPSLVVPYFVAGVAVAAYSEISAFAFKCPVTVYLILGFIPLVPGLTIFRTMQSALNGDVSAFAEGLFTTMKIGGAIVLGVILMSSFFRLVRSAIFSIKNKEM